MSDKKFTDEEMQSLKELQEGYLRVQARFGQVSIAKLTLQQQSEELDDTEKNVMKKVINIFLSCLILVFFLLAYKYYSYQKNIEAKDFNRNNIDEIINKKISNLPILKNDTNNVIQFNDGFSNKIKDDKTRSFWNLLKSK